MNKIKLIISAATHFQSYKLKRKKSKVQKNLFQEVKALNKIKMYLMLKNYSIQQFSKTTFKI